MEEKKTFFGKLFQDLIGIFKSNWPTFVAKLFTKIPADILHKVTLAVMAVEAIKKWLASDKSQKIVDFIPGEWDNELRDIVNEFLASYDFTDVIKLLPKDSHNIATTLTSELTDLSFGQSALTTEVAYQGLKAEGKI